MGRRSSLTDPFGSTYTQNRFDLQRQRPHIQIYAHPQELLREQLQDSPQQRCRIETHLLQSETPILAESLGAMVRALQSDRSGARTGRLRLRR